MRVDETYMSLADRMNTVASVEELVAGKKVDDPRYGMLSTTAAQIEQMSTFKHWAQTGVEFYRDFKLGFPEDEIDENFNPLEYIPEAMYKDGSLDYSWDEIMNTSNQAEVNDILNRAQAEQGRKDIIANGNGWGNFWGTVIGVMSSPEMWPAFLWSPAGGITRTALELGAIAIAETAAHEATLQQSQVNRSPYESLANVGTAAIFGGVIGAGIGKFVKPTALADEISAEVRDITRRQGYREVEDIPEEIPAVGHGPHEERMPLSGGAAESVDPSGEVPIRGMRWKTGYISVLRPLAKARIEEAHVLLNQLFGHDLQIRKNAKNVMRYNDETGKMEPTGEVEYAAKETAMSRSVDREEATYWVETERIMREEFLNYVGHKGRSMTVARMKNRGEYHEFNKKVRWAVSHGDKAKEPTDEAVTRAAGRLRSAVYEPIEKEARRLEMIDKKQREALTKNVQLILDRILKSEDPVEIAALRQQHTEAMEAVTKFEERVGDVKYADSYSNRRLHRDNVERDAGTFKPMLFNRYKELRAVKAMEEFKDKLADQIVLRKQRIIERKEMLAKRVAKAKKEYDNAQDLVHRARKPETVKRRMEVRKRAYDKWMKAKQSAASDSTMARLNKEIADREAQIKTAKSDDFVKEGSEYDAEIQANVDRTYQRILNGDLTGDIWNKGAHSARSFKERQLPLTDTELLDNGWLHTDMIDQVRAYTNSTIRPMRMKEAAGDVEMTAKLEDLEGAYNRRANEALKAGDKELHDSLQQEKTDVIDTFKMVRDRYYGRSQQYMGKAATAANVLRSIRNLNVMRMMGGVLLTSMNDLSRINAAKIYSRAANWNSRGPGLVDAYIALQKGTNKEALKAAGFAHETTSMIRLTRFVDMGTPILAGGRKSKAFLNMTSKGAKALMKATLLTQWTDHMKMVAAVMVQNQTIHLMRNYSKLGKIEKTILAEMGVDQKFAKQVMEQFDAHGETFGKYGTSLNWDEWTDQAVADRMKDVLFRQSERTLVTPRETDLPAVLADNELGRAFLQFKSFSLAAHNQTTVPLIERAQGKDLTAIYAMSVMSIGAVPTEIMKMVEAGREDELKNYSAMDWGLAVADRSAIAPMMSMAFNNIDMALGNRITKEFGAAPPSRYSDRTMLGALGPSASTIGDMMRLSAGLAGDGFDARDGRSVRRLAPFQNYMLLNRALTEAFPQHKRGQKKQKYDDR